MNQNPSRRSVLRGAAAAGSARSAVSLAGERRHLVLGYGPSQQTGWGQEYTPTIGGHTASADFTVDGTDYLISLLPSDPVYEDFPTDPTVSFTQTLTTAWDSYYSFRYRGGFRGRDEFTVGSYSAFADDSSGVSYGADLYLTYTPHAGDPPVRGPVLDPGHQLARRNRIGHQRGRQRRARQPLLPPGRRAYLDLRRPGFQLLRHSPGQRDDRASRHRRRPVHRRGLPCPGHRRQGPGRKGHRHHLRRRQVGLAGDPRPVTPRLGRR